MRWIPQLCSALLQCEGDLPWLAESLNRLWDSSLCARVEEIRSISDHAFDREPAIFSSRFSREFSSQMHRDRVEYPSDDDRFLEKSEEANSFFVRATLD